MSDQGIEIVRRIDRRAAIKWVLVAATSSLLWDAPIQALAVSSPESKGYGPDPDLTKDYRPGDLWVLTLTENQRHVVNRLCDLIIPRDAQSPAASEVGVPDFIDEWISAPYPRQREDRATVLRGLSWLDEEAQRRGQGTFVELAATVQQQICTDICYEPTASAEFKEAARFFARVRDLTAGAFYTTPPGMKDIGYVGNRPLATFDGPSLEALRKLGLV